VGIRDARRGGGVLSNGEVKTEQALGCQRKRGIAAGPRFAGLGLDISCQIERALAFRC